VGVDGFICRQNCLETGLSIMERRANEKVVVPRQARPPCVGSDCALTYSNSPANRTRSACEKRSVGCNQFSRRLDGLHRATTGPRRYYYAHTSNLTASNNLLPPASPSSSTQQPHPSNDQQRILSNIHFTIPTENTDLCCYANV